MPIGVRIAIQYDVNANDRERQSGIASSPCFTAAAKDTSGLSFWSLHIFFPPWGPKMVHKVYFSIDLLPCQEIVHTKLLTVGFAQGYP